MQNQKSIVTPNPQIKISDSENNVQTEEDNKLRHYLRKENAQAGVVEYINCISTEGKTPLYNECPGFESKQSNGEVPVMLELRGMWSTLSLPSLQGSLRPGVVAPDRVLSMGQAELLDI